MRAFDPSYWAEARMRLDPSLPENPAELSREELTDIAVHLRAFDWSYGDIALALGVPKTTVFRWTAEGRDDRSDTPRGTSAGWLIVGIGVALAMLIFRQPPGGGGSIRGGPP